LFAQETKRPILPAKIVRADTVYVDCVCPRGLAAARTSALQALQSWGRFQISEDRRQADLILPFSGDAYLYDYLTRDGLDDRPVTNKPTIMTVVDPTTAPRCGAIQENGGSWHVGSATTDLIAELRQQIEGQAKHWKLNHNLMCSVTPDLPTSQRKRQSRDPKRELRTFSLRASGAS
jgi:hypothetical protein